jgi:hypothetical protein
MRFVGRAVVADLAVRAGHHHELGAVGVRGVELDADLYRGAGERAAAEAAVFVPGQVREPGHLAVLAEGLQHCEVAFHAVGHRHDVDTGEADEAAHRFVVVE